MQFTDCKFSPCPKCPRPWFHLQSQGSGEARLWPNVLCDLRWVGSLSGPQFSYESVKVSQLNHTTHQSPCNVDCLSEHTCFSRVQERKVDWEQRLQVFISSRNKVVAMSEIFIFTLGHKWTCFRIYVFFEEWGWLVPYLIGALWGLLEKRLQGWWLSHGGSPSHQSTEGMWLTQVPQ